MLFEEKESDKLFLEYLIKCGLNYDSAYKIMDGTTIRGTAIIEHKLRFYDKLFNLSRPETLKIIVKFPQLLGMDVFMDDPTAVKTKLSYYVRRFGLSGYELTKILKNFPGILNYDVSDCSATSVPKKFETYINKLDLSEEELRHIFIAYPRMLSIGAKGGKNSIKKRIEFYKEELEADAEELKYVLLKAPAILGFDINSNSPTSAKRKLKALKEIFTTDEIKKNPILLALPACKIKFRYMLLYPYEKNLAEKGGLMLNERVAFSRICHLKERRVKPTLSRISYPEIVFNARQGKITKEYPLTLEVIKRVQDYYNSLTIKSLYLEEDEVRAILNIKENKIVEENENG